MRSRDNLMLTAALLGAALAFFPVDGRAQDAAAPKILLNQPLVAVEYQLNRLTDEELLLVERNDSDLKYRPVYLAVLTRKGVAQQYRDEAVAALAKIDNASRSRVLLTALAKVPAEDQVASGKLLAMLLAQPPATLQQDREGFVAATGNASASPVLQGAYDALVVADAKPDQAWALATKQGQLVHLLRGVRYLPAEDLRTQLFTPVSRLAAETTDASIRAEALGALGYTRRDAATFELLANDVSKGTDDESRAAAIRSLQLIPDSAWPQAAIEPLISAIVASVGRTTADRRTDPAVLDAIQFGEKLAARLPDQQARAARRDLRGLGVRVVRIQTIPEKLSFDLKWFAVEAGKPVQIVLVNTDAMPHNLIVSSPGSLEKIGTAAAAMPMPTDPNAKAFVPDSPLVLQSTRLIKEGDTERLGFTAPKVPGEYVFVCTFPGHWVRMYGIMLVVDNLDAWEAKPTVPIDPVTKQPFTSDRQ